MLVRPSGTEPKVKAYLDVAATADSAEARRRATTTTLAALREGVRALLAS